MARTDNSIVIHAPLGLVWEMTNDVETWPNLFTEYASVEVLERRGDTVRFRLTMHPDEEGRVWSWVSERTADVRAHTAKAHRIETGVFAHMHINWFYEETSDGVMLRWVQSFEMKPDAGVDGGRMEQHINTKTAHQMAVIKARVEAVAAAGS